MLPQKLLLAKLLNTYQIRATKLHFMLARQASCLVRVGT